MQAFLTAMAAMIVIAVGANIFLNLTGSSAAEKYSYQDVRLGG